MQDYINCPGGVIAPLILYSDVTFLSNNGKVTRPRQGKVDNRLLPGKTVKVSGKR
jgi:hypothetical protein